MHRNPGLARREQTTQVRIARQLLVRCRASTREIVALERQLEARAQTLAPLLAHLGSKEMPVSCNRAPKHAEQERDDDQRSGEEDDCGLWPKELFDAERRAGA